MIFQDVAVLQATPGLTEGWGDDPVPCAAILVEISGEDSWLDTSDGFGLVCACSGETDAKLMGRCPE